MWCIPPQQDAAFVAAMEQVLSVYQRPRDTRFPVVCMDEQPFQLISESRLPLPMQAGKTQKVDYEYVRQGSCTIWMFVEPLGGWREVAVTSTKKAIDWAHQIKVLVDNPRFAGIELVHTPKHGSWLNMAEPELSVLTRQCFSDRVGHQSEVENRAAAWKADRNKRQKGIDWQFTNDKARVKLKRLYPKIEL